MSYPLLQPLLQSGCVDTMMGLLDSGGCPDAVLAESTAALAILCAAGKQLCGLYSLRVPCPKEVLEINRNHQASAPQKKCFFWSPEIQL